MSRGLEIQKELEKANTYETEGNLEKAAKCYFKAATMIPEEDQNALKIYNKAFFTARKTGETVLMYQMGKAYYDVLSYWEEEKRIGELIPTFLEVSGRRKSQLEETKVTEEAADVLDWMMELYNLTGNIDAAYDISQETGDILSTVGQNILSGSYIIGKEDKWNQGLEFLNNAISAYQKIRLDKRALENIISVRLEKIARLIDIEKFEEGIEESTEVVSFFDSQDSSILPFSKQELFYKLAKLLGEKTISTAKSKQYQTSFTLMNAARANFEYAGKTSEVAPFLWQVALLYDEAKLKDQFFNLVDIIYDATIMYEDRNVQETILSYLVSSGKEVGEKIINSRRLMLQKGPIEFNNSEAVQYLLKAMDLATKLEMNESLSSTLEFLFQYAQDMYQRKLTKRSLPYYEFIAQNWYDLNNEVKVNEIIDILEQHYQELLTLNKFEATAAHLGSIVSIKTYCGDAESAGESAFSFAQAAMERKKEDYELEFLKYAYDAFSTSKSIDKLHELLSYLTQQSDMLFLVDKKVEARRDKLLELGNATARSISEEKNGDFLQATTFKALNSGLNDLGIKYANEAFNSIRNYDNQLAADILFRVGSHFLNAGTEQEKAIEFITKSTEFASNYESLDEIVNRNLEYLMEQTLESKLLQFKLYLANKLETVSNTVNRVDTYNSFLITFIQNLATNIHDYEYFAEMKRVLSTVFNNYHTQDKSHPKLVEILNWTNQHILEAYSSEQQQQMFDMALESLSLHEKILRMDDYLEFFWLVFEKFTSAENFSLTLNLYNKTDDTLKRLGRSDGQRQEITEKVVNDLNRSIKPNIKDEKFDEAWVIVQDLYSILERGGFKSRMISLYEENARLFAPDRLDLALTMWSQAIDAATSISDSESLGSIAKTIEKEILPIHLERDIPPAVGQLYTQAIRAYEAAGKETEILELYTQASKQSLTLGDFNNLMKWGNKGMTLASDIGAENVLFEFSDMYFGVGRGLLSEDPELAMKLISTASDSLRNFGESGFNYYNLKMAEIFEDLFTFNPELAFSEQEKILNHFRDSGRKRDEGNFLITIAKLRLQAGDVNGGLDQIAHATEIFRDLDEKEGLGEIIALCLKAAANYSVGSTEYQTLSNQASLIQDGGVKISEEKAQEAYGDIFDGLLDDMTSFLDDPERRKKREKKKKGK